MVLTHFYKVLLKGALPTVNVNNIQLQKYRYWYNKIISLSIYGHF